MASRISNFVDWLGDARRRSPCPPGAALLLVLAAGCITVRPVTAEELHSPSRSGMTLPKPHSIAVLAEILGIYVPRVENLAADSTGVLAGELTWNLRIVGPLGVYGAHQVGRMWWDNVSLLTMGHAVGLRYLLDPFWVFEAGYLGHRVEYEWVDGEPWSLGGITDHGAEVSIWGHASPLAPLNIGSRLLGRIFKEPKSSETIHYTDQLVYGIGLRVEIALLARQSVRLDCEALRVYRGPKRRPGVEEITWNLVGRVRWRVGLTERMGMQLGVDASNNWLSGIAPMLELKRSMIDEPMFNARLGLFWNI